MSYYDYNNDRYKLLYYSYHRVIFTDEKYILMSNLTKWKMISDYLHRINYQKNNRPTVYQTCSFMQKGKKKERKEREKKDN